MRDYRKLFADGLQKDLKRKWITHRTVIDYDDREYVDGKCQICKENDIKDGFRFHCEKCHSMAGVGTIHPEIQKIRYLHNNQQNGESDWGN